MNVPWYLAFGVAGLALAREGAVYVGMCPEPDFMSILIVRPPTRPPGEAPVAVDGQVGEWGN